MMVGMFYSYTMPPPINSGGGVKIDAAMIGIALLGGCIFVVGNGWGATITECGG